MLLNMRPTLILSMLFFMKAFGQDDNGWNALCGSAANSDWASTIGLDWCTTQAPDYVPPSSDSDVTADDSNPYNAPATWCPDNARCSVNPWITSCTAPNFYMDIPNNQCVQCDDGMYDYSGQADFCSPPPCDAGQGLNDGVNCSNCDDGSFALQGGQVCKSCTSDQITSCDSRTGAATGCISGWAVSGSICVAVVCKGGSQVDMDSSTCQPCPAGSSSPDGSPCQDCPDNTVSPTGSTICSSCIVTGVVSCGDDGNPTECSVGWMMSSDNTKCVVITCNPGQSLIGSDCSDCSAGTFGDGKTCQPCAKNFASDLGQSSCTSCLKPGVKSCSAIGTETKCSTGSKMVNKICTPVVCKPGYFLRGSSCPGCKSGTFSLAGASSCSSCPANQASYSHSNSCKSCLKHGVVSCSSTGVGLALTCSPGWQLTKKSCKKIVCGNGKSLKGIKCEDCPAGTFARKGANKCRGCLRNNFSTSGDSSCKSCISKGVKSCSVLGVITECSTGYKLDGNKCSKIICPAGQRLKSSNCVDCRAGTFTSDKGALFCKNCPKNKSSLAGQTKCSACNINGVLSCTALGVAKSCSSGFGFDDSAKTCTKCSAGSSSKGHTLPCSTCEANSYSGEKAHQCRSCGADRTSPAGAAKCTDLPCAVGKFRGTKGKCHSCSTGTYSCSPAKDSTCSVATSGLGSKSKTACIIKSTAVSCSKNYYFDGNANQHGKCIACSKGYITPDNNQAFGCLLI